MENINLKLENFEGPFDLLLKLVKINKMEISDISIHKITEQYMEILRAMEDLDMEIASEFFVMAATLIEIKSKELLPKKDNDVDEIDSKEILLYKLKEYEYFKKIAEELGSNYNAEDVIVTRLPMTIEEDIKVEFTIPKNFGLDKFFMLYMELLDRQKEKINTVTNIEKRIPIDNFKVEDMMDNIVNILKRDRLVSFDRIIKTSSCKSETIVLFLAVLELVRNHSIKIYQEQTLGELIIEDKGSEE